MNIEIIYLFLILFLSLILIFFQAMKSYRKVNPATQNDMTKNIHIIIKESTVYMDKNGFCEIRQEKIINPEFGSEFTVMPDRSPDNAENSSKANSMDKRKQARKSIQAFVDFVKEGKLFKETSRDISQSGIFLNSAASSRYNVGDFLTLAFQTANSKPQKHDGTVVRKTDDGIGINFIKV